jgi:hypothetical protein
MIQSFSKPFDTVPLKKLTLFLLVLTSFLLVLTSFLLQCVINLNSYHVTPRILSFGHIFLLNVQPKAADFVSFSPNVFRTATR